MNLPNPRRDMHQLAQVDTVQTSYLMNSGTCLAVIAKMDGNPECLRRCLEILEAATAYRPLQRPGNTYGDPNVPMVEGGDGVWLATGWGISGIVDMLTILGDRVPNELRSRLRVQLREEVYRIIDDWKVGRPWFVRSRKVVSNQWIEPTVGLIQACLFLGDPDLLPAYNFGIENLLATIRASGSDGAGHEGVSYSNMSFGRVHEMVAAVRATGDSRLADEPFLHNNWKWFMHMLMPGGRLVNCFDSAMESLPRDFLGVPLGSMGAAVRAASDPAARSTLRFLFPRIVGNYSLDAVKLWGDPAVADASPELRIPTFAEFASQGMVVWRSAFEPPTVPPKAWAVWIRGGSPNDNHTHRDQGQVSIYCGNRLVLMDCGTPEYSDPLWSKYYGPSTGHSVMQVGALAPFGNPVSAPVTVRRLDATGGDVSVDCSAGFPSVHSYVRGIAWQSAGGVDIDDDIQFRQPIAKGTEVLRFHLGSPESVRIDGFDKAWTVSWRGTVMRIRATSPVMLEQQDMPDRATEPFHHAAIKIRVVDETSDLRVSTHLELDLGIVD